MKISLTSESKIPHMNDLILSKGQVLLEIPDFPAISIILPFEPKMSLENEIQYKLKLVQQRIERDLLKAYPAETVLPVLSKLQKIIHGLNYNTHKKSIAIFVSQHVEKVYYLDVCVNERIVIDESFEIRDLIYCKKQAIQYLLLTLSGNSSRIYRGESTQAKLIKMNIPSHVKDYERDMPEQITHYSDQKKHKEILLDKFLHQMDNELSQVLGAYQLPLIVMGSKKVVGHFDKITRHSENIIRRIYGNYEKITEKEIFDLINTQIADWKKLLQQSLLQDIENAENKNLLSVGMKEVWQAAIHQNAHLLIVEKDFALTPQEAGKLRELFKQTSNQDTPFYIGDLVDDVMEKVLIHGGDVEFVENGSLEKFEHIVVIRHF